MRARGLTAYLIKRNLLQVNMETENITEPVVGLTPGAADEVKALLATSENAGKMFRVYVEQGGCSGMQYSMIFDEQRPDDSLSSIHGVSVLVDPFSAQYLRGAVVDFSEDLVGGGFKISNPAARQSCGCGKSFTA
jgi:iron-sulfur cluster assembly accessory protein